MCERKRGKHRGESVMKKEKTQLDCLSLFQICVCVCVSLSQLCVHICGGAAVCIRRLPLLQFSA